MDEAILRAYGLKLEKASQPMLPRKCNRCTALNHHDIEICYRCGFALTEQAAFQRDDELQKLKEEVEDMKCVLGRLVSQRG